MNPQKPLTLRNRSLPAFEITLLVIFLVVCALGFVSSRAQAPQANAAPPQEEREFKNTIPDHVPLKVKIKNEQTFKNSSNKNWARDFEIEVKNTGDRPIYFIYMLLVLPDVQVNGYPYALQLTYGRNELVRLSTPVQPDDKPIRPDETITLKISQDQLDGYEHSRDKEGRAEAKKVQLDMQLINFGDGTGLTGADGHRKSQRGARSVARNLLDADHVRA
jgi:hypothetical protein